MQSSGTYKVIVSGVIFQLSEKLIRSDSPNSNSFATSLLGDFAEADSRTLELDRNPTTFKLIRDHLRGYTIFPLDESDCAEMSEAKTLIVPEYYGLDRLHELVTTEIARTQAEKGRELELEREKFGLEKEKLALRRVELQIACAEKQLYGRAERMKTNAALVGHGINFSNKVQIWDAKSSRIEVSWTHMETIINELDGLRLSLAKATEASR